MLSIKLTALGLATTHYPIEAQRTLPLRHHSALPLIVVVLVVMVIVVNNNPVVGAVSLMGLGGIGVKRGEVPTGTIRVQNR